MSKIVSLINDLLQIKDELVLQAHLLELESKDEWHRLCEKFAELEKQFDVSLTEFVAKVGRHEEQQFVGNEAEIASLLSEFQDFKDKN